MYSSFNIPFKNQKIEQNVAKIEFFFIVSYMLPNYNVLQLTGSGA